MTFYYFHNIYFILPIFLFFSYIVYKIAQSLFIFHKTPLARNINYEYSKTMLWIKYSFLFLAFLFLSLAMLRPQWGIKSNLTEQNGRDLIFVLDVSQSMKATDMDDDGKIDRLSFSKAMISDFVNNFPANRYGLIVFAGEAFVSTPLTLDTDAFLTFLDGIDYDSVRKQGTDLSLAITSSLGRFSAKDNDKGQAIILISDGGNETEVNFSEAVKRAKELGIKIFTIGIGSKKEVPIPIGRDLFGKLRYKTYQGQTVLTKLNEKPLKEIASLTEGNYYHAKNAKDLRNISNKIAKLKENKYSKEEKSGKADKVLFFLWPSFIFFLIYLFLDFKNNFLMLFFQKLLRTVTKNKTLLLFLLLPLFSGCSINNTVFRYYNHQGNQAFNNLYLNEARTDYKKAIDTKSKLKLVAENNKALTFYYEEKYDEALSILNKVAVDKCQNKKAEYCDQVYYNLGNTYYRLGEKAKATSTRNELWQKAIKSYKSDLEINKEDKEATENIEFILKKLKKEEQSEKNKQKEDSNGRQNNSQKNESENSNDKNSSNKDSQSEDGQKKSSSKTEEKDKNEIKKNGNSAKNTANGDQSDEKNNQQMGQQANNSKLSDEEKASLDQYVKQMKSQQKKLQKYFNQNGVRKNNSNNPFGMFDDFFDDPFFDDFVGKSGFNNKENFNEKDW